MRLRRPLLAAALAIPALFVARADARGQSIERHQASPPGLILQGVSVPAGATTLYLSGQVAAPIDPGLRTPAAERTVADFGDTRTQTVSVLRKIEGILAARGYTMRDVIKLTVFLVGDPARGGQMDFAGMNEGFRQFFGTAENPNTVARSTIQVAALAAPGYLVEIEATAARVP
jgi:enamine deaminase RidA (YjgF/YER057c/UK114 family)